MTDESVTTNTRKSKRWLRCNLTDKEKLAAGKTQADKALELIALENDAARISKEFKAKIAGVEADLQILANKISSGYEHRSITCTERLGFPAADKKTITRDDTFETVSIEDLTDLQMELPG